MDAASPHLARLAARARPAGGPAAAEARGYCADVLRSFGFAISEQSFEYSAFPGSWAAPIAGYVASLACIALFVGRHIRALAVGGLAGAVVGFGALWMLGRFGTVRFPFMRRRGVNLQAVRGGDEPEVWLVAHIDSKWQPVSMIARIAGVVVTMVAGFGLVATNLDLNIGDRPAAALLIVAWLGSIPLMMSIVRDTGPGAVDNASGVAAVLEAAGLLEPTRNVGVLITDAEELALAGARAWARTRRPGVAINCDSIDDADAGTFTIMHTANRPTELVERLRRAAKALGEPITVLRQLPGVLTDSIALADAGWRTVTLSRGSLRTLRRIHTSRDTLDSMRGTGIAAAAQVLAATATEMS